MSERNPGMMNWLKEKGGRIAAVTGIVGALSGEAYAKGKQPEAPIKPVPAATEAQRNRAAQRLALERMRSGELNDTARAEGMRTYDIGQQSVTRLEGTQIRVDAEDDMPNK